MYTFLPFRLFRRPIPRLRGHPKSDREVTKNKGNEKALESILKYGASGAV